MNGVQTCMELRNKIKNKEISPCLLIISSANNSEDDIKKYKKAGCHYVIEKPINLQKVKHIIL